MDVLIRDGAEELPVLAGTHFEDELYARELVGDRSRGLLLAQTLVRDDALLVLELVEIADACLDRETPREEIVAGIPGLHLDDVADGAEVRKLFA
jgi:hypothetical protein